MKIVAFAGPSLPPSERASFTQVEWRPPAQAGDLLRLEGGPELTICLIDGYFDHRPAVRHKEILLLLSEGVRMFGASSIGALRAAEMDRLGMIGVGSIYGAFARGSITGDDEVALVHGPADKDWRPLSLPLVDVRATLRRALREGVLEGTAARAMLKAAAATHYVERDWPAVLAAAGGAGAYTCFEDWLPRGQVEQKKLDALACLVAAASAVPETSTRPAFVRTPFVEALARGCGIDLEARGKGKVSCASSKATE